jgi:lambda family phage portal protein
MADATTIRAKARSLTQNVPYIAAALDAKVAMLVGTGIMPRATGRNADTVNSLFAKWVSVCDADGRVDFYGMQSIATRAMEIDGEVLIRLRPRRPDDGLPVPLQLQLLEIDWLDTTRTTGTGGGRPAGLPPGNTLLEGIEYDAIGRVVAYWLWEQHPGDTTPGKGWKSQSRRIDARFIIHLYDPRRPGQGRGISSLATVISRTRDTQLLEDAELARKNLETRLAVIVSGDASTMSGPYQAGGSATSGDATLARQTGDLGQLPSGAMIEVPTGANVSTIAPHAVPGHVENIKHHLHLITAALGVTYESATGDMSEVNFSSARMRQIDVRRQAEQLQWLVLIPRMLEPIWRAFIDYAVLGGKLRDADHSVQYATPKWDYVNPQQEVAADVAEISSGLSSISEKLRRRGYEPKDVFDELARDFDALRESGVLEILLALQKAKIAEAPAATSEPPPKAKKSTGKPAAKD